MPIHFTIDTEREDDGRWIAEVPSMPGVMVYGSTRDEVVSRVQALALRVLADRMLARIAKHTGLQASDL